jgi:hypothetical protein
MPPSKKKRRAVHAPGSFSESFQARLDKIEADAKAAGANMTIVCKLAKISRADPVRWRNSTPHTVRLIDRMEKVVRKLEEKHAREQAALEKDKKALQ